MFIAVIAAPLWAISHATPDGHDAFGSGERGYVLLMSVTLRPALTMLAMFGSIVILYAMDTIFAESFSAAFDGAQSNAISGPIGFVVAIFSYMVLSSVLVYSSYRMCQTIPDAIFRWVGGSDDDSIGVEQHSEKANALLLAGYYAGNIGQAAQKGAQEGRKAHAERGTMSNTGASDLAAGKSSGGEVKG